MMIEKIVLNYLSAALSVPVAMEAPQSQRGEYVLIEKTGSGRQNRLNSATLAIQSYADSLYAAAELNEAVKAAMDSIVLLNAVTRSSLNSDYNFTDTETKRYRYQAVYDLTYYDD